jgi:hypothetical protein
VAHASYESYAAHVGVPYGLIDKGDGVKERPIMTTMETEEIYMRRWLSRSNSPSVGVIILAYDALPTGATGEAKAEGAADPDVPTITIAPRFGDMIEAIEMHGGMFDITNQPIQAIEMLLGQSGASVKVRVSRRSPLLAFGVQPIRFEAVLSRQSGTAGDTPDNKAAAAFGLQLQQIDLRHEAAAAGGGSRGSSDHREL